MRIARASAAIYGLSHSTVEITAQQWFARVHRADILRLQTEYIRAFKQRRNELVNEFRFVRPGGEVKWIEARSLIDYDGAGRAERITGVYIDVTERRKAADHKSCSSPSSTIASRTCLHASRRSPGILESIVSPRMSLSMFSMGASTLWRIRTLS